jgi:hypothetical protein
MPSGDQWFQHEPERGSREHAIQTTLRNHRSDLYKITDQKERSATIDAMVQRIDEYDKLTDPIVKELGPRMQVLESQRDKLPKNDQKRVPLQKEYLAVLHELDRRRAPFSKALHKDLDNIVKKAVLPYRKQDRAFLKNVTAVSKNLRSREIADAFKARQKQQKPAKDLDRER